MKFFAKLIIAAVIFYAGWFVGSQDLLVPVINSNQNILNSTAVRVMLDFGNGEITTYNDVSLVAGNTAFDLLKTVTDENNITLEYKDYGGELGVFIEAIGGVKNDAEQNGWWQYWVNNEYAQVGPSSYELTNGDVVMWKYVKGQF